MFKYFVNKMDDSNITMVNFINMPPPDAKAIKDRERKVKAIIEQMGDKYRLAVPLKKLH